MTIASRFIMKPKDILMILLVILVGLSGTFADPILTEARDLPVCDPKCGCDGMYIYDSTKEECVLNLQKLMKRVETRYDKQNNNVFPPEDSMAKSIYDEGQFLFRGIMISVILFLTCAIICVLSACIYCCRINYTDRQLKNEVKLLAKKMQKDPKKESSTSKRVEPKAESCNVIVQGSNVFVV